MLEHVLIGIGSNLNGPTEQVQKAFSALNNLPDTVLTSTSSLYQSLPQGPQDQDKFINAVALIETTLSAEMLLTELKSIEETFGRVKKRHWGERIIDLDILFYGTHTIDLPDLQIPHIQALSRDFVLIPALEICPKWELPGGKQLSEYQDRCLDHELAKLD